MRTIVTAFLTLVLLSAAASSQALACGWWHPSAGGTNPCSTTESQ